MANNRINMEALYQQMILAFGRAGVRTGCIALVYSRAKRPAGFRFVHGKDKDDFSDIEKSDKYDLIKILERRKGVTPSLPTYVELDELVRGYHDENL